MREWMRLTTQALHDFLDAVMPEASIDQLSMLSQRLCSLTHVQMASIDFEEVDVPRVLIERRSRVIEETDALPGGVSRPVIFLEHSLIV